MPTSVKPFFFVWTENSPGTREQYFDEESALEEARRKAELNPERNIFVMRSNILVKKVTEIQETEL